MKISEIWLREWINPAISNNELINQLNMSGINVVESKKPISSKFYGVVIGKIIRCKLHPNFNNIWITQINNGSKKLINIICNDINCRKNLRVVVANEGALLPNGKIVTSTTIYGEKSEGVLCTFAMLGLYNYTTDIIKLPNNSPIGHNFYDYLNLNDNIIDVNITPNRGDCLNIIGIAREIAAINQLKLKKFKINTFKPTIEDTIPIIIEDSHSCPQFLGKILKNINVAVPTPLKIQDRLYRCGIQPSNVVSDIANYVLLEFGNPIDAFDYEKIDQNILYVRFSKYGETLSLFDKSIQLFENTLIIADQQKPLSIAGIIIGKESHISCKTRHIFLQSAFFNPKNIAEKSKLYNLSSFSAIRYERGVNPNTSELALNYATALLLDICQGDAGPTIKIINHSSLPKANTIVLHHHKLNKILGFHINRQKVTKILKNLGFTIKYCLGAIWHVTTPPWRFDVSIEENLISEVIRLYGYNNIPQIAADIRLTQPCSYNNKNTTSSLSRIKTVLVDRGYHEIITYSFINPNIQKLLHPYCDSVTLINPINQDMSVMRLSLWSGLITTVVHNQHRYQKHIRLFEAGICFFPEGKNNNNQKISQKLMIAGIRSELKSDEYWSFKKKLVDFYDIKGDIESIFNITEKFNKNNIIIFKQCFHAALHPKKSAAIYFNTTLIGYVGLIHPIIQKKLNLYPDTLIFELSWSSLSQYTLPKITNISKFPKNYRDISLIVPSIINASDIINVCKNIKIDQLIDIKLIDIYTGKNIPKGHKSFTIELILQGKTHTLKEQEISKIIDLCVTMLKKQFHVILR